MVGGENVMENNIIFKFGTPIKKREGTKFIVELPKDAEALYFLDSNNLVTKNRVIDIKDFTLSLQVKNN